MGYMKRTTVLSIYRGCVRCEVTTDLWSSSVFTELHIGNLGVVKMQAVNHSYIGGQESTMKSTALRNTAMNLNGVKICKSGTATLWSSHLQPKTEFALTMSDRSFDTSCI